MTTSRSETNYTIDASYKVNVDGTSDGTQDKYLKDGWWYKQDKFGNEGLNEYLASLVLSCSNLKKEDYVEYESCRINHFPGCRSKNFIKPNQSLKTLYRLYANIHGGNLAEHIYDMNINEQKEYIFSFLKDYTGDEYRSYFANVLSFDQVILNSDRNINNIAFVYDEQNDSFSPSPIFDNGKSLFCGNYSYNSHHSFEDNYKKVSFKPFHGGDSLENLKEYITLNIDCNKLLKKLLKEPDSFSKQILIQNIFYQIERQNPSLNNNIDINFDDYLTLCQYRSNTTQENIEKHFEL